MFKVGAAVVAGGCALTMALQSVLIGAAAPQQHSTLAQVSASKPAPLQGQAASRKASQGRLFGQFVSATARTVPAGPQHGKVISALARTANPGHTRH